jgi:hypothetical protein
VSGPRWSQSPMEAADYQAKQAAAQQVHADLAADLHGRQVMAHHEGQPSIAVQNATHGAGIPAEDRGKGS